MRDFIICTFYTPGYKKLLDAWERNVIKTGYEYIAQPMEDRGKWSLNDCIKPEFIKSMMLKYPDKKIVWVDIDGQIIKKPVLFESIKADMAGHRLKLAEFEWKYINEKYTYKNMWGGRLVVGGTLMFNNTEKAHNLVDLWMESCQLDPNRHTGDQDNLNELLDKRADELGINFYKLPFEYAFMKPSNDSVEYEGYHQIDKAVILHVYTSPQTRKLDELKNKRGKM